MFLLIGCGLGKIGGSSDNQTVSENNVTVSTDNREVEVFTLGPVINALVRDANNQVAVYDKNISKYVFKNPVAYPVTAVPTSITYVDVDFDGNKTANDILPKFKELKSFNNEINLITNLYFSKEYNESNVTEEEYESMVKDKFDVDLNNSPVNDETYAKLLFAAYNYSLENNITSLNDIDSDADKINVFFTQYLQNPLIDNRIKYYSMYDALLNLDKKLIQRVDCIHKPDLKILMGDLNYTYNNSVDVFDSYINGNFIYTASGHEELAQFEDDGENISYLGKSDGNILSFGLNLYDEDYGSRNCLFLADSKAGVKAFDITDGLNDGSSYLISKYYYDSNVSENITDQGVISVNGYISPQGSKRLLAVSTLDKGFYLINMNNVFNDCSLNRELNATTDFLISSEYDSNLTGLSSYSTAIRNDGTYLYESTQKGIFGFDISVLDRDNILSSQTLYTVENNESSYNLLLVNNNNELFVSTDKGVQVYSVDNNNELSFLNEYDTEGANPGYYPKMDFYDNYLFLTDGYDGLKIIKYDNGFQPMLCGVVYFAPETNNSELAKVNSVKYNNGYLYVGVDNYGIVKFKLEDALFKHCR